MDITIVEIQPTGEFGGHIFEYESDNDLFKCVNDGCGIYEVVARRNAREQGIGEITPCPGTQLPVAENAAPEPAGNGCPRGCKDPNGEDCKASIAISCPQGRYSYPGEPHHVTAGYCPGCGSDDGGCYCGEE